MDDLSVRERVHLKALAEAYTAWHITVHGGVWRATLNRPVSDFEQAVGVLQEIRRADPIDLSVALAVQYAKLRSLGFVVEW